MIHVYVYVYVSICMSMVWEGAIRSKGFGVAKLGGLALLIGETVGPRSLVCSFVGGLSSRRFGSPNRYQ
jgi:hypothetical protein